MNVRLLCSRCGHTEKGIPFAQQQGQIVTVSEADGIRMIEAGQAELVERGREVVETAMIDHEQHETAAIRRGRKKVNR